jgi:hypothetical protein
MFLQPWVIISLASSGEVSLLFASVMLFTPFLAKNILRSFCWFNWSVIQGSKLARNSWAVVRGVSPNFHLFKIWFRSFLVWLSSAFK